jgi:hypothetical protein
MSARDARLQGYGVLFALDPGLGDQLPPFCAFALDEFCKSLRRSGCGFGAENADFLDRGGIAQRLHEGGIQRADDLGRRAGGRDDPEPADGFESAQALLGQRGTSGRKTTRLAAETPSAFNLPSPINCLDAGISSTASGTWPARTSVVAGAVPR